MLWVLTLDTSAQTPITRVSVYRNGNAISGLITTDTQLIRGALFTKDRVYLLGSTSVLCYDYKGSLLSSQLIYGWNIEDAQNQEIGEPLLALTPDRAHDTAFFTYPAARLVQYRNTELLLSLPPNCLKLILKDKAVYCFSTDTVYAYGLDGSEKGQYPLGITLDQVSPLFAKHVLAFSADACYLLPLP